MTASAIPAKKVKAKKNSQFLEVLKRLSKNKTATIGLIIIVIEIILAILAPLIIPYDPNAIDIMGKLATAAEQFD